MGSVQNLLKLSSILSSALLCATLFFSCANAAGGGGSGDGNGGGNAQFVPPAIEMKTGPEIQTELQKIGFSTATQFISSKTAPDLSILSDSSKVVLLSNGYSLDEYVQKFWNGEKLSACIAWNINNVIFYYAYGYTDKGNKIPLNADSSNMFYSGSANNSLTQIDLSCFDTEKVTNMSGMFRELSKITMLDLTGFNVKNVTDTSYMFYKCSLIKYIYVKSGTDWSKDASVTNSDHMFGYSMYLNGGTGTEEKIEVAHSTAYGSPKFTDVNKKPVLDRIEVNATNAKKTYFTGETADSSGLVVTAYYKDGVGNENNETVASGYETSLDSSAAGEKNVTVSFTKDGVTKTATYTVTVSAGYVVTVKHMFENLADSNYTLMQEEKKGFASGTTYTPATITYDSDIFTLEESLSPVVVNENKTIEVKYKRSLCAIAFTAVLKDETNLQFDSSYKSQIEAIPGVSKVTVQTLSDNAAPKLKITAKSGTSLAKLNDANFVKVKGYRRDASSAIQTTYSESANKDANGYAKVMKPSLNGMEWKITWRLPTINMKTGNSFYADLWELGAKKDAVRFLPSKTPPAASVAAADKRQISLNYSSDGSQQMEVLAYAWRVYDRDSGEYRIHYYAECGNDAEGYPKIPISDVAAMFNQCSRLQYIDLSGFDIKGPTSMESMFRDCARLTKVIFGKVDTSKVETMKEMFCNCENLEKFEYPNFVTAACKNLSLMFYNCSSTKNIVINMSNWNTSNVTTMSNMFAKSYAKTLDISNFDMGKITDVSMMFGQCPQLQTIYVAPGTDWSKKSWQSTDMFNYCLNLSGKPSGRKYSDGTGVTTDVDKSYAKVTGGFFTAKN